jgi:xanthine dehydrogenase/oxidase
MSWADNAYTFSSYLADAKLCHTNTAPCTNMRAPGVVQSCVATELVIHRVAAELGLPVIAVQQRNFVTNGSITICGQPIVNCTLQTVWNTLLQRSRYEDRMGRCEEYNANNLWRKRGISITPVRYGIGWKKFNAGVRLGVQRQDGTIIVVHTGLEIGQGINTKVAQVVASTLNVDVSLVHVSTAASDDLINGGWTGSSGTSETVCQAAVNACSTLNERLQPYIMQVSSSNCSTTTTTDWVTLLDSLPPDVSLNTEGWYSPVVNPNGEKFQYFVYAACVSEIELDVLSGEVHVLAAEIAYDCGQSLNPAVDIGQIEGAFVMGLGYFLTEHKEYSIDSALLETAGTWEYKPPLVQEIPSLFNVTLLKNMYNTDGILGSKAVGEPPMICANSVYFALRMAISSARRDAGCDRVNATVFDLSIPATVDERLAACLVHLNRFVMPSVE